MTAALLALAVVAVFTVVFVLAFCQAAGRPAPHPPARKPS